MRFEDNEIGGRATGPINIRFHGDEAKCHELLGLAQVMLGNLKNRMSFSLLVQDQEVKEFPPQETPEGSISSAIFVRSIKGFEGSADIDFIEIAVVAKLNKGSGRGGRCLGYIVQAFIERTGAQNRQYVFSISLPSNTQWSNANLYLNWLYDGSEYAGFPDHGAKYLLQNDVNTDTVTEVEEVIVMDVKYTSLTTGLGANTAYAVGDMTHIPVFPGGAWTFAAGGYNEALIYGEHGNYWGSVGSIQYFPYQLGDGPGGTAAKTQAQALDVADATAALEISYQSFLSATIARESSYNYTDYEEVAFSYPTTIVFPIYKHKGNKGFITGSGFESTKQGETIFTAITSEFGQSTLFMVPDKTGSNKYDYSQEVKSYYRDRTSSRTTQSELGTIVSPTGVAFSTTHNKTASTKSDNVWGMTGVFGIPVEVEQGIHKIIGTGGEGYYKVHLFTVDGVVVRTIKDVTDGTEIDIKVGPYDSINEVVTKK